MFTINRERAEREREREKELIAVLVRERKVKLFHHFTVTSPLKFANDKENIYYTIEE